MELTELPMATLDRDAQPLNAISPMDSTESGMATEARDLHS